MNDLVKPSTARRPRGRPSAEEASELREAFLQTALRSFLDLGYAATSIEAIARDAGVAKITIYRQFSGKQELFREVAHRALERANQQMQQLMVSEDADTTEALRILVERMYLGLADPETRAVMRLVVGEAERFPELAASLYSDSSYVLAPVAELLAKAHARGELHVPNAPVAAAQLAALTMGGLRFLISKPLANEAERRAWAESVIQLVLKGWQPREPVDRQGSEHSLGS
jgi:AcrR family transcriptional regulator